MEDSEQEWNALEEEQLTTLEEGVPDWYLKDFGPISIRRPSTTPSMGP